MVGHGRKAARASALVLVPAAVVVLAVAAIVAQLADRATLTVQQCVSGTGLARFGVGLALLRTDDACPHGTLALGGDQRQVMGVVIMVALPVLAGHLAAAVAGIGVLARLHRLLRTVLGMLIPALRTPVVVEVQQPVGLAVEAPVDRPTSRVVVGVPQRRGPPQLRFA